MISIKYLKNYLLIIFFIASSVLLSSCAEKEKMKTEAWCSELRTSLESLGLGWPIAKEGKISPEQAEGVESVMSSLFDAPEDGDLAFVSSVWQEKYTLFRPYLEKGGLEGFNENISESDKKEIHLANVSISNFCQWNSW